MCTLYFNFYSAEDNTVNHDQLITVNRRSTRRMKWERAKRTLKLWFLCGGGGGGDGGGGATGYEEPVCRTL